MKKIVSNSHFGWGLKLRAALWAYRVVACNASIGTTPLNMVYSLDIIFPMEFLIPTLRVAKNSIGQAMNCQTG